MSVETDKPGGWTIITLGDIVEKVAIKVNPIDNPNAKFIGMDCIQPNAMKPHFHYTFGNFKSSGNWFKKNQVLYGRMRPYLNKVFKATYDGACSGEFIILDGQGLINPDLLTFMIHHRDFVQFANKKTSGDRPRISFDEISTYPIKLPPLPEQYRIVAKIEELFSSLEKGVESLKSAQQQLKVYRQAVLKWAFEGRLTNENVKDGELPEGWKWVQLGTVLAKIEAGKSFKCDERTPQLTEIGVLKVSAVTWQIFNEFESKTVIEKDRINHNYFVQKDDFLFSRANTLDLVGAVVIVNSIERKLMLSDKTLRFHFSPNVSKKFILYYLRGKKGRNEIQRLSTGNQESMRNIGQERIKQIEFPFPTLAEQHLIVSEIETRLSVCDKIEETIAQSLQQAEALRQSILKKAFEGKLVPQDPSDEPASVLLERIREKSRNLNPSSGKKKSNGKPD